MFESFVAVPAHFTIEFLGFLVFAAGMILAFTRTDLVAGEPSNRLNVAIGFGALSAAQVLHGGSFAGAETDGTKILIALKTLGLAFVVIGIVGSLKIGAAAAAGWSLKEPLLLASTGASVVLFFAALAGARSEGRKTLRRLALFAIFFALAEGLTAGEPHPRFGTQAVSGIAYAAHGFKLLAYFALGAWIWSVVRSSIRTRFVASFAVLLVAVVLALSTALTGVISNSVEVEELRRTGLQLNSALTEIRRDRTLELKQDAATIAQDLTPVRNSLASRSNLPGLARDIRAQGSFELDHGFVMMMDPNGTVLGFSGDGPYVGRGRRPQKTKLRDIDIVTINGSGVIGQVAERGSVVAASVDRVGRDLVAILAAHEVPHPDQPARRAGIVAIGRWVDALDIQRISESLGAKTSMLVHSKTVASTLPKAAPKRGLIPPELSDQTKACAPEPVTGQITVGEISYFSAFACLKNDLGDPVATFVLSAPATNVIQTRGVFTRILFLIAMGVGAIALVLAWFSGRAITQPIQDLTTAAGLVREGNLQAQAPVTGEDEVGQLGETFNEMTASLFRMTNDLREAARQESTLRARIETIIESMADGLIAVDADRKVLAFNRAAELITGVDANEAIDRDVADVLDARDAEGRKVSLPIFELARGAVDNVNLARGEDDVIPVAIISELLPGGAGESPGAVAVLRDMTREREVERMKSEFLSNISHELRTPLTPIKGYAEILGRKDIPPEKAQKFVGGILESTVRLERIVHLLVDFAAMEAGRLAPKTHAIDLTKLINDLVDEWAAKSPLHSVEVDVKASLPPVAGDERLLRRSLEEVLDNAVKFSPEGGTIRVEAEGNAAGNGHRGEVQISVSDQGIGISAEDVGKIFSDFQQLDGSETRSYGGLGLGLAFVRRIVEAHAGSVAVESMPDQGTRLTITLPASSSGLAAEDD